MAERLRTASALRAHLQRAHGWGPIDDMPPELDELNTLDHTGLDSLHNNDHHNHPEFDYAH